MRCLVLAKARDSEYPPNGSKPVRAAENRFSGKSGQLMTIYSRLAFTYKKTSKKHQRNIFNQINDNCDKLN